MAKVIDTSELDAFAAELQRIGKDAPKHQKKFMLKEGTKLRTKTRRAAGQLGTKTGNYNKSIRRGKVYSYDGAQAVRVYSSAPHAHLIENGHRMVTHDGTEAGFVPGHHVFEVASKGFESTFLTDVEALLDAEVTDKL